MNTQVVLITGALTGIGRAAAIAFAQDGSHVVVSGRRDKEGQELAVELQALGAEAIFVRGDVRSEDEVHSPGTSPPLAKLAPFTSPDAAILGASVDAEFMYSKMPVQPVGLQPDPPPYILPLLSMTKG